MREKSEHFYEFDGVRLFPAESLLVKVGNGARYFIRPKERDLLVALLKRAGQVVTYEELREAVWPESEAESEVTRHTVQETKRTINRLLKDLTRKPDDIIQSVPKRGYRFDSLVTEGWNEETASEVNPSPAHASEPETRAVEAFRIAEPLEGREIREDQLSQGEGSAPPEFEAIGVSDGDERSSKKENSSRSILIVGLKAARRLASRFDGHFRHVLISCVLYAMLYPTALLIEVAYKFDQFGAAAWLLAPPLFLWIFSTSLAGLAFDAGQRDGSRAKGLTVGVLCFIAPALISHFALSAFLPNFAVTQLSFQAQTAQGAYLKNVLYFLPLAVVFVLLPFHFIMSLKGELRAGRVRLVRDLLFGKRRSVAPENTVFLRVWQMVALLCVAAALSLAFTMYLLDHLKPGEYANLFTQFVLWRIVLYFALGAECVIWYAQSLNAIKRECLNVSDADSQSRRFSSHYRPSEKGAL